MIIKYLRSKRVLLSFLSVLFIISIISGFIIYNKLDDNIKLNLVSSLSNLKSDLLNNHANNFLLHIIIISIITILSFTVVGYILSLIYLFYEGLSIGFTICYLIVNYKIKGLFFSIIYNVLFKFIYLILLIFLLIKLLDISKNVLYYLIYKDKNNNKIIKRNIYGILIIFSFIIINDLFLYFIGNFLIKNLINML